MAKNLQMAGPKRCALEVTYIEDSFQLFRFGQVPLKTTRSDLSAIRVLSRIVKLALIGLVMIKLATLQRDVERRMFTEKYKSVQ